jgi:hypothetical protein
VRVVERTDDLKLLIQIYYTKDELSSEDIRKIFPGCSKDFIARRKREARRVMVEDGTVVWSKACVNTDSAFKAWGIKIEDIEARALKLQRLQNKLS